MSGADGGMIMRMTASQARCIAKVIQQYSVNATCSECEVERMILERAEELGQGVMDVITCVIQNHGLKNTPMEASLEAYYEIKGLMVMGPREWRRAFTSKQQANTNPLGLTHRWCSVTSLPPWTVEQLRSLVKLCRTPEWQTIPILWLALRGCKIFCANP